MKKFTLIAFLVVTGVSFAQDDSFFFESFEEEVTSGVLSFSYGGTIGTDVRIGNDLKNINGFLNVDALFETDYLDLIVNGNIKLDGLDNIDDFPLQNSRYSTLFFMDTLFLRYYHSLFDMEVGLLKPIWGNADGVHAVDVLNSLDYSEPFSSSYLDSKISQQMAKLNIPFGDNSLLEVVYLPTFKGDYIPMSGIWAPAYIVNIKQTVYNMAYARTLAEMLPQVKASDPSATPESVALQVDSIVNTQLSGFDYTINYQESEYFTDSQFAGRFTTSLNSFDLGFIYYYGFSNQPTIDPVAVMSTGKLTMIYNRVQTMGFDVAAALGSFNLKGEVAYNLTKDTNGDDPGINNNSLKAILGFDINLPVNNVNFLIQSVSNTVLGSDNLSDMDPQYSTDNRYTTVSLMGRLSDNYLNETLYIEVTGAYYLFDNDFMVKPKVSYNLGDNSQLYIEYLLLEGEGSTTFGQYSNNDTFKFGFEYNF